MVITCTCNTAKQFLQYCVQLHVSTVKAIADDCRRLLNYVAEHIVLQKLFCCIRSNHNLPIADDYRQHHCTREILATLSLPCVA